MLVYIYLFCSSQNINNALIAVNPFIRSDLDRLFGVYVFPSSLTCTPSVPKTLKVCKNLIIVAFAHFSGIMAIIRLSSVSNAFKEPLLAFNNNGLLSSFKITFSILMKKFASTLPFSCGRHTLCYSPWHYQQY